LVNKKGLRYNSWTDNDGNQLTSRFDISFTGGYGWGMAANT